jgi:hypothetical protein
MNLFFFLKYPDLIESLGSVYEMMNARTKLFPQLSKLQGKLQLVMSQVDLNFKKNYKGRYRISIQIRLPEIFSIMIIFPLDIFIHIHYETLLSGKQIFLYNRRVKGLQDPCKIPIFTKKPWVEIF